MMFIFALTICMAVEASAVPACETREERLANLEACIARSAAFVAAWSAMAKPGTTFQATCRPFENARPVRWQMGE